jgi:hypothetical protein
VSSSHAARPFPHYPGFDAQPRPPASWTNSALTPPEINFYFVARPVALSDSSKSLRRLLPATADAALRMKVRKFTVLCYHSR